MALWGAAWGAGASSGSVTTLIPKFAYVARSIVVNATVGNKIAFGEGGSALTATVASSDGDGWEIGRLCGKVKRALQAAGAGTYTVTYSLSTKKFTITKSAGTFTLDVGGASVDLLPALGFTSDKSGALTYTSDVAVPSTVTVTCTAVGGIRRPQLVPDDRIEDTVLESGYSQGAFLGGVERYDFFIEFETPAVAQALRNMWRRAGRHRQPVTFYPNSTDSTIYAEVYLDRPIRPIEMTDRNLVRHFRVDFSLRFKRDGDSTITDPGDLLSRAFS